MLGVNIQIQLLTETDKPHDVRGTGNRQKVEEGGS